MSPAYRFLHNCGSVPESIEWFIEDQAFLWSYTVKRVDEVVRHPHLVTQDQFTQVSKKVSDIPAENFTINIKLFRQTFTIRQNWIVSKAISPVREPRISNLLSDALPLRHALFLSSGTLKDKVYHILRNTFLLDLVHPSWFRFFL